MAFYHHKFDKNDSQFFNLLKGEGSPPTSFTLVRQRICAILCLGTLQQRLGQIIAWKLTWHCFSFL